MGCPDIIYRLFLDMKLLIAFVFLLTLMLSGCFDVEHNDDDTQHKNNKNQSIDKVETLEREVTSGRYPEKLLWGDTHVHSNLSADAHSLGNKNLSPREAYRFARGERVKLADGSFATLDRPLDFLVVADHAEYLGVHEALARGDEGLLKNKKAQEWHHHMTAHDGDPQKPMTEFAASLSSGEKLIDMPEFQQSVWLRTIDMAEEAYSPGSFTTLMGYEWSSAPEDNNLHRVVVFRDNAEKVSKHIPFSALDGDKPEMLWEELKKYEQSTGGRVLAIPHNPNVSGGKMFETVMSNGLPIDHHYAETRAHFERVVEVTQVKGDSETHPFLSPDDEFADFERWDRSNIGMREKHQDSWFKGEYVRAALKMGLQLEEEIGVNPYQLGMIGSSDQHNSLSDVSEDDFPGKFTTPKRDKNRWKHSILPETALPQVYYEWELAASGYAAVWASENTREEVFDSILRRETYATTGPRIEARFFAGWDYDLKLTEQGDWVSKAYALGKPMGQVLRNSDNDASPIFLLYALKDPQGANLDRIQVVKGWVDEKGEAHEKVFDAILSDHSRRLADGSVEVVGNTVNTEEAKYDNSIGTSRLLGSWQDPEFDRSNQAFYYMRVLEIPTPRWTTYDIASYGAEIPQHIKRTIQERVYTSPIWVAP